MLYYVPFLLQYIMYHYHTTRASMKIVDFSKYFHFSFLLSMPCIIYIMSTTVDVNNSGHSR